MLDILLTGAGGGIGRATTRLLMERGHRVFATDRVGLQSGLDADTGQLVTIDMDVSDPLSIDHAYEEIKTHTSGLDGIVNNAGWFDQFPLMEGSMDRFDHIFAVNVTAAQKVVHTFFPLLHPRKGRVINVSSESALALMPLQAYGMTKKMLDTYTEVLRQELSLLDMKVVTVRPGAHLTPFIQRSVDVLEDIYGDSLYAVALENVKKEGTKILKKVQKDPGAVARAIVAGLEAKRPRREYWVNVSWNFRILRRMPSRWREALFRIILSRAAS